ncbi:unnamed protein product [Arctogadus glacialis]
MSLQLSSRETAGGEGGPTAETPPLSASPSPSCGLQVQRVRYGYYGNDPADLAGQAQRIQAKDTGKTRHEAYGPQHRSAMMNGTARRARLGASRHDTCGVLTRHRQVEGELEHWLAGVSG